jgi:gluconokinase
VGGVPVVIGVDVGTTSAKAVAVDARGRERGSAETRYPLLEPAPGRAEQDPGVVVDGALEAIRGAVAAARDGGGQVVGLSLSAAMHALIALDAHDRPLTRLITWADTRAHAQAQRLRAERPELHDRTGTPIHAMAPLAKLAWFAESEPKTFAAARRWVGVKELVVARLTGTWALDHSTASGTGLLNLEALDWDREAVAAAGIGADRLATLVPTTERLALARDAAAQLDLDVPLVVGAADGPLANLGVGAVEPGVAACSIGTSGALRLMVRRPAIDRRLFCYALTPGRWVVGGATSNGGVVLQWAGAALAPDLGEHAEAQLIALAQDVAPGSEGLLMLPYLLSERAPLWGAAASGAYVGLARHHGRGHLVRAALEGVCQQLALVLDSLRDAGNEVRELRATGGFARSAAWRRMLADVLGTAIGFPTVHEGSAFGAALLGMEALGLVESIDVAAGLVEVDEVIAPDPAAAAVYAEQRPTFVAVADALRQAVAPYQPT